MLYYPISKSNATCSVCWESQRAVKSLFRIHWGELNSHAGISPLSIHALSWTMPQWFVLIKRYVRIIVFSTFVTWWSAHILLCTTLGTNLTTRFRDGLCQCVKTYLHMLQLLIYLPLMFFDRFILLLASHELEKMVVAKPPSVKSYSIMIIKEKKKCISHWRCQ